MWVCMLRERREGSSSLLKVSRPMLPVPFLFTSPLMLLLQTAVGVEVDQLYKLLAELRVRMVSVFACDSVLKLMCTVFSFGWW